MSKEKDGTIEKKTWETILGLIRDDPNLNRAQKKKLMNLFINNSYAKEN